MGRIWGASGAVFLACMDCANAAQLSVDEFIATARAAEIVVLGEVHDNPGHHKVQAEIVAALQPGALVFEMVPQALEGDVNALRDEGAGPDQIAEALDWAASGWPDFGYYSAIMEAASEARIFGAGQPAEDVMRAGAEGAAEVFGPDASVYGLDQPLDPEEQAAREALQAEAHCDAMPSEALPGMVEAQRFRDAGLANAALWARATVGEQVVVITGTGHAVRNRGMPAALALAAPEVSVLSLGQFEAPPQDPDEFDAWMVSSAPEREDPCATFAAPAR